MKVANIIVAFLVAVPNFISANFEGTNEEFLETVVAGKVPHGVLEQEIPMIRKLQLWGKYGTARKAGDRCGNNNPCEDGLQCTSTNLGNFCTPTDCLATTVKAFIDKHQLGNYAETIMQRTGYLGENVNNATLAQDEGLGALASRAAELLSNSFRRELTDAMSDNPPNMTELLNDVVTQCPFQDTPGVTVMLGFHYELAALLPKMYNNFYFALGNGDIKYNFTSSIGSDNKTVSINPIIKATGGVFSDLCWGVGPDIGFDIGLTAGVFLSGTSTDLTDCSFMWDADIAVGSGFGLAVGVTSNKCKTKIMMTIGGGLGGGVGCTGCNTFRLSDINF